MSQLCSPFAFVMFVWGLSSSIRVAGSPTLLDYVNTLIGTSYYEDQFDVHDYGNTAPFAGPPFAHTPWTAQTRDSEDKCKSAYYYFDPYWQGMRRSHWMSGSCTIDYGSATVIPSLLRNLTEALSFHKMNHSTEFSTPSYYRMNLTESSMVVEAASDVRAGIMKVTPSKNSQYFYLIFKASDTMYNESTISIYPSEVPNEESVDSVSVSSPAHRWYQSKGEKAGFSGHHYFKTSRPACEHGIINGYTDIKEGQFDGSSDIYGTVAAYFKFESSLGEVLVATGTSFISVEKAMKNLNAELDDSTESCGGDNLLCAEVGSNGSSTDTIFDFNRLVLKVSAIWEERLGKMKAIPFTESIAESQIPDKRGIRTDGQNLSGNSSLDQLITFYSALWHSQLLPRIVSDHDGEYLKFGDGERTIEKTNSEEGFSNYFDDFSMWDILRAQIPLFNLVFTDHTNDMVTSLIRKAKEGGWLPIFPAWNSYTDEMIGDHCAVLIADSYQKGIISIQNNNSLLSDSYHYLVKNAISTPSNVEYRSGYGRRSLSTYSAYGFIPLEDLVLDSPHPRQQVSRTLEYAYDDYVVSQFALLYNEALKSEVIPSNLHGISMGDAVNRSGDVSSHLLTRSQSYRWVMDGDTTHPWYAANIQNSTSNSSDSVYFVRGRYANLTWTETLDSFDPATYYTWLTETNVWQYSFSVLHDVEGMIQIYGGEEKFIAKLDKFFDESWYNHGNEPDHHALYLYAYVRGSAWKIQKRLPEIVRTQYGPLERSMSGNDDAGQMSAWLVMSSMGLYQVCPGCGGRNEYVFGLPLFSHMEVSLPSSRNEESCAGKSPSECSAEVPITNTLIIDTIRMNNATTDTYVQLLTWNGCTYDCAFLPHSMISLGGRLTAYLGPDPNKSWGGNGRKCMDQYIYPGDKPSLVSTGKIHTC